MGILDSMTQQSQPQTTEQSAVENPQGSQQQGSMAQMYQMLMQNSINAIANVAQQRIQEKRSRRRYCRFSRKSNDFKSSGRATKWKNYSAASDDASR